MSSDTRPTPSHVSRERIAEIIWSMTGGNDVELSGKIADAILPHITGGAVTVRPELAREQPCGCIVCQCEGDEHCQGCGAKSCGSHPVGEIPNPVYVSALTPASEPDTSGAGWRDMDVSIVTMKMSGDREEYYVRVTCDGRSLDVRKYGQQYLNRAKYERDELRHVLLGEPKPDLMAPQYADLPASPDTQPDPVADVQGTHFLKRIAAHLALNAHIKDATGNTQVAHNVGVDTAIAEILKLSRGETALRALAAKGGV